MNREDRQLAKGRLYPRTPEEERRVSAFLKGLSFGSEEYWASYPSWAKGGNTWMILHEGGTGIMKTLCWYQHVHKPGSKEWRPGIIIDAVCKAAGIEA